MRSLSKFSLSAAATGMMALTIVSVPVAAHADVTWTLSGVTFSDGGTASGTFTTDNTGIVDSFDITTTTGGILAGESYTDSSPDGAIVGTPTVSSFEITSDDGDANLTLSFTDVLSLTNSVDPGAEAISGYESTDGASRSLTAGEAVPEPVSMALLGTGLLGLGASRRRRRA